MEERDNFKSLNTIFNLASLQLEPITSNNGNRMADYSVYRAGNLIAYCEMKSVIDDNINGLRSDPAYNKIQTKIHTACIQLGSINRDHSKPNIIAFVNHNDGCNIGDVDIVLTGTIHTEDKIQQFDTRYKRRLLKAKDFEVWDYIIWFDRDKNKTYARYNKESKFNNSFLPVIQKMLKDLNK